MITITKQERFDDVGPEDARGYYEWSYHGYNYELSAGEQVYRLRTYDDEPGVATIVSPTDALTHPMARQLIEFAVAALKCSSVHFYCGETGTYRRVSAETLEFLEAE